MCSRVLARLRGGVYVFAGCSRANHVTFYIFRLLVVRALLILVCSHHISPQAICRMSDISQARPYHLSIPESELDLLHKKLNIVRFPDEVDGGDWDYGAPLADIKRLASHWGKGFDWRKAEARINELPMFTCDIEVEGFGTLNIHYVHQKSTVANAIPLLFCHGCKPVNSLCCLSHGG